MAKKLNDQEEVVADSNKANVNFVTQLIATLQNLGARISSLEIGMQKTDANQQIFDKRIELINEKIDLLKEKSKK